MYLLLIKYGKTATEVHSRQQSPTFPWRCVTTSLCMHRLARGVWTNIRRSTRRGRIGPTSRPFATTAKCMALLHRGCRMAISGTFLPRGATLTACDTIVLLCHTPQLGLLTRLCDAYHTHSPIPILDGSIMCMHNRYGAGRCGSYKTYWRTSFI